MKTHVAHFDEVMKVQDALFYEEKGHEYFSKIQTPFLMVRGGQDQVTCVKSSKAVYNSIAV